jgi:hypothetical protein
MKKIFLSLLFGASLLSQAQETTTSDALRYALNNLTGTARFRGMSGAFGAVGGDLSAININPAGAAIFNHNYASVSSSLYTINNRSDYFGTRNRENYSTLDLNQIGAVFVFNDKSRKTNWSKIAVALNYDNTNDFDTKIFSSGTNPSNSIDRYFLDKAQGLPNEFVELQPGETITDLYTYLGETSGLGFPAQQAMMAYQAYLLESDGPGSYYSNVNYSGGNFYQENSISATGYNGKLSANIATSYKNRLFLGMNLNAHFTDYVKTTSVYEANNNPLFSTGYTARNIQFDNELYTYGTGFSLNLGAILKVTEDFRAGVAYESPTWYRLNDELSQRLTVNTTDGIANFQEVVAPNVVNVYPTYKIQTPSKITFSGAYIFNKKGLISIDYAMKDYSNTRFKPTNESLYRDLNTQMSQQFKNTYELRVGGEYRIKQWSIRGGYRFEESPFKSQSAMSDLIGYSAGFGYNFRESKIDFAFANVSRSQNVAFLSSGMNDAARVNTTNNNVTLTYSIFF